MNLFKNIKIHLSFRTGHSIVCYGTNYDWLYEKSKFENLITLDNLFFEEYFGPYQLFVSICVLLIWSLTNSSPKCVY